MPSDDERLDGLERAAFGYFADAAHPVTGLVADTSRRGAPCSISVVGFALSVYPVGVERGWMERADAVGRTLRCLRFFAGSDASGEPGATGMRGFYFHFLDMQDGRRMWASELSLIDTALLIAGVLTAATYFDGADADEHELRTLADALYRRVEWRWAQREGDAVSHGWKPECGFLPYSWEGYSEALLMYVLGLGSPTHPLTPASYRAFTRTYQWENLYGIDCLQAGPLFIHQFSHAWIDFRGIRDDFMREKKSDYFENSRRATLIQRDYAIRNPLDFLGYGIDAWGLSASDGSQAAPRFLGGRDHHFHGYAARGVPYGPDDGTLSFAAAVASIAFAPDVVLPLIRSLEAPASGDAGNGLLRASGYNLSVSPDRPWIAQDHFGLDQGLIVLMIENHRSGLPWRLGRRNPVLRRGLERAGFRGGWLRQGLAS